MHEEPFEFSRFPAMWGPPLSGVLAMIASLAMGHLALSYQAPGSALAVGVVVVILAAISGRFLARSGILRLRWMRMASANLVAARGEPRIWLVAHADSKSQTIPMLVRIGAVAVFAATFTSLLASLLVMSAAGNQMHGETYHRLTHFVNYSAHLSALSILPVALCFIGNRSNGALDNGTGVAAVLAAAGRLQGDLGVLITSAEELGLAGARAFGQRRKGGGVAINCDTVDDGGSFIFMSSARVSARVRGAIAKGVTAAGAKTRSGARLRRMLPGVLADSIALSDAGWESFTISRGNLRTLRRVHTGSDNAASISGNGVEEAAALITEIVKELH